MVKRFYILLIPCFFALAYNTAFGQLSIKGTVYDSLGRTPIEGVAVLSSSGTGAVTDSIGRYTLPVTNKDSIWFSYQNKPTKKFAVKNIGNLSAFDISLRIYIPYQLLPEVRVRSHDYLSDSIARRETYAKIYGFQRPGLETSTLGGVSGGVGFDLDALIESFRFRKNRYMLAYQRRLLDEEKEAFIRHRFSKTLVQRLTDLTNDVEITKFINLYLPSYLFTALSSDYDFHKYIKDSYQRYKRGYKPTPMWKEGLTEEY